MGSAFTPTSSTKTATEHLRKELESVSLINNYYYYYHWNKNLLKKILTSPTYKTDGYSVDVVDDNIYKWHVK